MHDRSTTTPRRRARRFAIGSAVAALGLALVAPLTASATTDYHINTLPPQQVAPLVMQAAESVRSFHMVETEYPHDSGNFEVGINVASVILRTGILGYAELDLQRIGNELWIKPNVAFWRLVYANHPYYMRRAIAAQDGKWLFTFAGSPLFRSYRSYTFPADTMRTVLSFPINLVRIPGVGVDGRQTYGITGALHGDRVYAALHEQPYPLLILSHVGQSPAYRQRISAWNYPLIVPRPVDANSKSFAEYQREAFGSNVRGAARGMTSTFRLAP